MKRLAVAALALISLLGLTGCDLLGGPGDTGTKNDDPKVTLSDWKIKGSFDGWAVHQLTENAADANQLTFVIGDLSAIDYEFVLINPAGVEVKYSTDDNVTPGTEFTLGGDKNVSFTATKLSYKLTVNVTDPAAPVANLIAGSANAMAVTNQMLLDKLKIKGNQFSQVGGVATGAWSEAEGTVSGTTESFDVLVDNKTGEFGFTVLEGFVAHVDVDTASLTATTSAATTGVELLTTGGNGNVHLTNMPKSGSVYTVSVTVDATKEIGTGRYMISVALKTLGTDNWAFAAWTAVFVAGDGPEFGAWTAGSFKTATISGTTATYQFSATKTPSQFKIVKENGWGTDVGFAGIEVATGSIALVDNGGNIGFTSTVGTSYTITVSFAGNYLTTGKPIVKVVTP